MKNIFGINFFDGTDDFAELRAARNPQEIEVERGGHYFYLNKVREYDDGRTLWRLCYKGRESRGLYTLKEAWKAIRYNVYLMEKYPL